MFPETTYTSAPADAALGDLLVLLTDGLIEVFDRADREFGFDRIKALIGAHAREPLADIESHLLRAVRAHGPQIDDQTLLLVRVVA
jgi:serine phosphatase RsbU (regulator of sigma subunit)